MDSVSTLVNSYLKLDTNWSSKQNLELIRRHAIKSTDIGYQFLRSHTAQMDSALGKNTSKYILSMIAFDEIILPLLKINGEKVSTGWMSPIYYSGDLNKNVDWKLIKEKLDASYPDLSEEVFLNAKTYYFQSAGDWKGFCQAVDEYAANKRLLDLSQLNNYANSVVLSVNDPEICKEAIKWCNIIQSSMDKAKTPQYLTTYAYLLYKSGQKDTAIKTIEEYFGLIKYADEDANKKMEKMKANTSL